MRNCLAGRFVFYVFVLNMMLISVAGAQQTQENNTNVSQSP